MSHETLLIQHDSRTTGWWWVNCCGRIVTRDDLTRPWCATQDDARDLADWHLSGERGPAPGGDPERTELVAAPRQLSLFA
ncbi:hypothetical protein KCMC57_64830 (plasmid) [Kitasatospora sp. CMC57]|uniref:Uncharacterized protein n=1 Tax=Kitasatospora sp. CMC57 TaxID=3231513 RepID=A0AB33KBE8_9ACTN